MWQKFKNIMLLIGSGFVVVSVTIFSFFYCREKRKEKQKLEAIINKHKNYIKDVKEIEKDTQEKIDRLNGDDDTSFNSSVELLHEAGNRE